MTLCASFLLSCIMGASVFAQGGYEVKGVVVDAIGPVIGATVIEAGSTNGASTGLDGDYYLTVSSADAVIEISCIGYATQSFVASQLPAVVTLSEDTTFLDEVVVIGYGSVKKEDIDYRADSPRDGICPVNKCYIVKEVGYHRYVGYAHSAPDRKHNEHWHECLACAAADRRNGVRECQETVK